MIHGANNGNYEIVAYGHGIQEIAATSAPLHVTVSRADVTGLELGILPLASVSGQVLIEASANLCVNKSKRAMEEIMISAQRRSICPGAVGFPLLRIGCGCKRKGGVCNTFSTSEPVSFRGKSP